MSHDATAAARSPGAHRPGTRGSKGRALLAAGSVIALAALTAGCETTKFKDQPMDPLAYSSAERHPILVSNEPEVLDIPVGMNGPALSPEIETVIRQYVQGYRANGTGMLAIQVPSESANEIAAARTGKAIHYALVRAGVPRGRIQVAPYYVGDQAKIAVVRLAYLRVKATVPQCGLWPEKGPYDREERPYSNLGCALQQNLAAMVANPADLVAPQPMTPANAARRSDVITVYATTGNTGWAPSPKSDISEPILGDSAQ